MKNKKTAWVLLPAVLAIWGLLGWKVYAAMKDDPVVTNSIVLLPAVGNEQLVPDTYQLLLDYPDPFLGKSNTPVKFNPTPTPVKNNSSTTTPKIPITVPLWPEIRYAGLVKSPKDGKVVGFLYVEGVSYFVKNGDVVGVVMVKNLWRDSVMVVMGKEKRFVRK